MYYCSVNGQPVDVISIGDRGLAYGDGIFTTAKIASGKIELLTEHLNRLETSCHRLKLTAPDLSALQTQLSIIAKDYELAVLKIMITAGQGGRGYSRKGVLQSNVIISVHQCPSHYINWQERGIMLGDSAVRLGINPMFAGIKHLNRLEQVLIRNELDQKGEDDVVVCNINGDIIEASSANIFWLSNNILFTPDLSDSGVQGLMRDLILKQNPNTQITKAPLSVLTKAESIFICNTVMGIIAVKNYNGRELNIAKVNNIQHKIKELSL